MEEGPQIQVRFTTRQTQYAVTDTPIVVPTRLKRYGLSEIINHLLGLEKPKPFDFLIDGEFLRTSLNEYLVEKGLSTENLITIEYVESMLPPTPLSGYKHDDWIGAIDKEQEGFFLTGCYDNKVRVWNKSGDCVETFVGHEGPIKSVKWMKSQDGGLRLLSGSHDQTVIAWEYSPSEQSYEMLYQCVGHKGSIESIAVHESGDHFLTASWDGSIKFWNTESVEEEDSSAVQTKNKRRKAAKESDVPTKVIPTLRPCTPLTTLDGHVGSVSSIIYNQSNYNQAFSGGWDHSIRIWDLESRVNVNTKNCEKVVLDVDFSEKSGLLASGHSDRSIRLWDPRSDDSAVVKLTLSSHQNWVSSVSWSEKSPFMLVSGSYDSNIKVWDIRSKAPLYTISGASQPDQKVLAVEWSNDMILSGGEDCSFKIHSAKLE
ncbi:WD40 repeat-like protein [Basidiobolus meristosporus CBS 931.73]|uniref:Ribosome biogenesis protein YTM1 n=1 Tax=Basidiobolus meristosporus CBS 931.73 TaxID=1314790 RepID=A0A1Y1X7R9_9FUNG|nr:WD40 repeat-like protein [Basidiobolus meristosporus CBS 931.73]|eukprot:ORX81810.1 WD40 repeat-like protein [Basidiobolus meristosporus CBS 931.73]